MCWNGRDTDFTQLHGHKSGFIKERHWEQMLLKEDKQNLCW